mmetsp:Transcript_131995/g.410315  ORF Transcript_131995/g.410315 Transcript_131995/m.410315 type:complete len:225 (+) Transcript_131995:3-677(+)
MSPWEKEVIAQERGMRAPNHPRGWDLVGKGPVVFVGSSIWNLWRDLLKHMAPIPTVNSAFGGSRTWEVLEFMDRNVLPYRPRLIVYYCGSNDVNHHSRARTSEQEAARAIRNNFAAFVQRVHAALPECRIIFASIIRAPEKQKRWSLVDLANRLVEEYCSSQRLCRYLDLHTALEDRRGRPRMELYVEDKLHYRREAYASFREVVRPAVEAALKEAAAPPPSRL